MSDLQRAQSLLDMNKAAEAVPYASKAVAADPESPWPRHVLVRALIEARRNQEAVREGQAALGIAPDDPWLQHLVAVAHYQSGNYKQAVVHGRAALEMMPEDPSVHAILGKALSHTRDKKSAREHADRAVALAPDDHFVHRASGDVWVEMSKWKEAEGAYRKALELDPQDSLALTNLGFVMQRMGKHDAALEHTLAAARTDPRNQVATGNVVQMGRAAVAGGGLAIYIAFRLASLSRHGGVPPEIAAALALAVLAVWGFIRYRRFQRLPDVVKEALRAQRRIEGPGSLWAWLVVTYVGVGLIGFGIGRTVDGDGAASVLGIGAIGVALTALGAFFVKKKLPYRDPAQQLAGSLFVWSALALIGVAWMLLWIWMLIAGDDVERGMSVWFLVTSLPIVSTLVYICYRKATPLAPAG